MNNNLFDDIIKQSVEGHEAPVPADVWEKISGKKRKRRYIFFWWLFAFLMLGSSGIFLWKKADSNAGKAIAEKDELHNGTVILKADTGAAKLSVNEKDISSETAAGNNADPVLDNNSSGMKLPDGSDAGNTLSRNAVSQRAGMRIQIQNPSADNDDLAGNSHKRKRNNSNTTTVVKITSPETEVVDNSNNAVEPPANNTATTSTPAQAASTVNPVEVKKDSSNLVIEKVVKEDSLKITSTKNNKQPKEKTTSGKWRIEISATPTISFQEYSNPLLLKRTIIGAESRDVFTVNIIKTSLTPSVAYTASLSKDLNKQLAIGAGIQYMNLKEKISLYGTDTTTKFNVVKRLVTDPVAPFLIDDTVSVITTGNRNIAAQNSYAYINIPVFAQYQIAAKKKWSLAVRGGLNFNIKTTYKNKIQGSWIRKYATGDELQGNKTNVGVSFFGGMKGSLQIRQKIALFVMPVFIYNPRTYDLKNAILNKRISSAGISVRLSFQIR